MADETDSLDEIQPWGIWITAIGFIMLAWVSFWQRGGPDRLFTPDLWGVSSSLSAFLAVYAGFRLWDQRVQIFFTSVVIAFGVLRSLDYLISEAYSPGAVWTIVTGFAIARFRAYSKLLQRR